MDVLATLTRNYKKMNSLGVLCASCSQNLNDSKDIYTITKCGHVYHGQCLRKIMHKRTCTICHTIYDPRQCCKLNLFSESDIQCKNNWLPYEYDWMYCDQKTNWDQRELSKCLLKLGNDSKSNDIYAARVFLNKQILPAYYVAASKCAIATFDGHAYELKEDIDLLDISSDDVDLYKWVKCKTGQVPENALDVTELTNTLVLGEVDINRRDKLEEKLYIARGEYKGKMLYGKLCSNDHSENKHVYLAYGSEEMEMELNDEENCEVLVRDP